MAPSLLLVDDDGEALLSLARALGSVQAGVRIEAAGSVAKALEAAQGLRPDVAVIDLSIEPAKGVESGFELLQKLLSLIPECRVIVLTGHGSLEYGVRALSLGAASFVEKPGDVDHLSALVRDGFKQAALRRAYNELLAAGVGARLQSEIVGSSPRTTALREELRFAGQTSQPVLLCGETGTGKGLCAHAIHRAGASGRGNFVRYQPNYASADLVSSELFGHVKGAFTGALSDRPGLIAEAEGGTLFLDEIDELPQAVQVSLLGVLQERVYRPVGSDRMKTARFRLICATNRPVDESLSNGRLRPDFFHRVAHLQIELPPLRERLQDIAELCNHFLAGLRDREGLNVFAVTDQSIDVLRRQKWPGNIRQLQALVENAAFRAGLDGRSCIDPIDLRLGDPVQTVSSPDFNSRVEAFKLHLIEESLARNGGNQVRAAADLNLDRSTLRRILERAGRA